VAIKSISTKAADSIEAVSQFKKELGDFSPTFILFFASSIYDASQPAKVLQDNFPNCKIVGSTSHSEYFNNEFTNSSISFMAMDKESIEDVCVKVISDIKSNPDYSSPIKETHTYFGGYDDILNGFDKYVGIVLFEGSAKAEEYGMDKIGNNTDILYVGGTSSEIEGTSRVYADGQSYENAAVLATLKTVNGYNVLKTQSAEIFSDKGLTVTKSDVKNRIMYELDNRPVAEVYAEVLGIEVSEVSNYFVSNPLGVLAEDEIFIRTFDQVQGDGISLHCGIPEGTEIYILKIGDIIKDTREALDNVIKEQPAGVINFNCLYRTLEITNKNLIKPYCDLFGRYTSIGFSTYGEAYLGHINETSTVLIIN